MRRSPRKKRVRFGTWVWKFSIVFLCVLGIYQLVHMTQNALGVMQQHTAKGKTLWETIKIRFWEEDVPVKSTPSKSKRGSQRGSSREFLPKDKAKLERVLEKSLKK